MLEDIRVLSAGNYVAGPMTSQIFSNLGADVIKVEHIKGGDPYRYNKQYYDSDESDDLSYRFLQYNRGKRSLPLNLKDDKGIEIFKSLVETADVVIENQRPGKMEEFGLDYSTLSEVNEDLIYCSISGYGESGPYKDKAAFDGVIQSVSGLAHQNSQWAGAPTLDALFVADAISAMTAAFSTLAAIMNRMQGGSGTYIDVSLLDSLMSLFGSFMAEYSAVGSVNTDPLTSHFPYGMYEVSDGWILLIVIDKYWEEFCGCLDLSDWSDEHGYDDLSKRKDEFEAVNEKVKSVLAERTTQEWMEIFPDDLIIEKVNTMEESFTHPQVQHRDAIQEMYDDTMGEYIGGIYPPTSVTPEDAHSKTVPRFGEHAAEILAKLGYDAESIKALHDGEVTYSSEL